MLVVLLDEVMTMKDFHEDKLKKNSYFKKI